MPRLPIKKTKKLAEAQRLGELQAEYKFEKKTFSSSGHQWVSIKNHLGKALDRIPPLKLAAVLSFTYIIKTGIEWSEEIVAAFQEAKESFPLFSFGWFIGVVAPEEFKQLADTPQSEVVQWMISFGIAYILVEHGGELLAAGGSVLGAAKGLIGILTG